MKWNNETIRQEEKDSIYQFLVSNQHYFTGVVLDYGCGLSPYRAIVEGAGADYVGYDRGEFPASVTKEKDIGPENPLVIEKVWSTILCNQVMQYIPEPEYLLDMFRSALRPDGFLVMTYPTTWPEVENEDLWRFTKMGMHRLMTRAGFRIVHHEQRAALDINDIRLAFGYGVVGQRW